VHGGARVAPGRGGKAAVEQHRLERALLAVPAAKGGRGRVLPLPPHVASALRDYARIRPRTDHEFLFVGIGTLAGTRGHRDHDLSRYVAGVPAVSFEAGRPLIVCDTRLQRG